MKLTTVLFNFAVLTTIFSCTPNDKANRMDRLPENPRRIEVVDTKDADKDMWHIKNPDLGFEGIALDRLEKKLNLNPQRDIVVAVIDSGVDSSHPDLVSKMWLNPGEVGLDSSGQDKRMNKIDDDQNGYVDDVHGWNFIGGAKGESVSFDTLEITREVVRYEALLASGQPLTDEQLKYFEAVKTEFEETVKDAQTQLDELKKYEPSARLYEQFLKDELKQDDFSLEALEKIESKNEKVIEARDYLINVVKIFRTLPRFYRVYTQAENSLKYFYNKSFKPRSDIVGDNEADFTNWSYGNNDIAGKDASHGTHVAGIIGAEASRISKARGIGSKVKIMALRVIPNGDEHDKDVAAAVRYAVKNGAQIINMSFGKDYSPYKQHVDEAFLLAEKAGVLMVHAAGNSAKNLDQASNFPTRKLLMQNVLNTEAKLNHWIEVGSSTFAKGLDLLSSFSNYGTKSVDLFAPGSEILSTIPNKQYAAFSGTSMASPVVAGSAAYLMERFKSLKGLQTKALLLDQVRTDYDRVRVPGTDTFDIPVLLIGLSRTGGVLDLEKSVVLADQLAR